ncbi:DUF2947 family protein [Thalassotalea aquiviva]|uniref:DUF2947 family protein n=1 Tax=Thalassotalea aquiviva TaxID=3242415 RepID=UPI00352A103C
MAYISIDDLKHAWVFKRKDLPISESDFNNIKPMTPARSATLWAATISNQVDHPDFFTDSDWVLQPEYWLDSGFWETTWEGDELDLPEPILAHLDWQDNTVVYFCLSRKLVIESNWGTFKRCWKNFLMMDDGPFLVAKKRPQVVQFLSDGSYKIGNKPN